MDDGNRGGVRVVRRIYIPRIIGLGLGFFCVASVFYQTNTPVYLWVALFLNGFAWPHVAYLIGISSDAPFQAEQRNILIDAIICSVWIPLMGFNLLPSAVLIIMLSLDCITVGGPRLLLKGLVGMALSIALTSLLTDVELNLESNLLTILFCLPMLLIHPLFTGANAFKLLVKLGQQKRELEQARIQAEEGARAKTRFLATASHDLRQPMHAIGMFTAALGEAVSKPDNLNGKTLRKLVGRIEDSQHTVTDLLDSLLSISKLDAGVITPSIGQVDLAQMINRLSERYQPIANEKGLEFKTVPAKAVVKSDAVLLERILSNLLANAVRYTPSGKILFGCRKHAGQIRVMVCDTGQGIPESKLEEIFQEFSQLDTAFSNKQQGLGLGLAIVNRLSGLLTHPLSVDSVLGRGSTFGIDLPLATEANPLEEIPIAGPPSPETKALTIFAIDDEPDVLDALHIIFDGWGHRLVSAKSTKEAHIVARSLTQAPDFILSDYRLGAGETGTNLINELRVHWKQPIPAAIITGDTSSEPLKEVVATGLPLLHKPLKPLILRELVEEGTMENNSSS